MNIIMMIHASFSSALVHQVYFPQHTFEDVALVFLFSSEKKYRLQGQEKAILLGYKKRGMGQGKYVGIGGHVEEGETSVEAMTREAQEEIGVNVKEPTFRGNLEFIFLDPAIQNIYSSLYSTSQWDGQISESEEIMPQWFNINDVPYEKMWQDAQMWLSFVIEGKNVHGKIIISHDNENILKTHLKIYSFAEDI